MTDVIPQLGLFITLEGIEGVGKTTQMSILCERLRSLSVPVCATREPGGTMIGNEIRDILLKRRSGAMDSVTELLLMFAARSQHLTQVVRPALAQGYTVVCDRFTDATYAYQGGGRGLDIRAIEALEHMVQGDLQPDYTFILDAPPVLGLQRAKARGSLDRIEEERVEFFDRVRGAYLARALAYPERCHVIDATQTVKDVSQAILDILCPLLALRQQETPPR